MSSNGIVNKKSSNKNRVLFWSTDCRYEVIINNAKKLKWRVITDEEKENKCNIYWCDVSTINERFKTILPWQMFNHFPGMVS